MEKRFYLCHPFPFSRSWTICTLLANRKVLVVKHKWHVCVCPFAVRVLSPFLVVRLLFYSIHIACIINTKSAVWFDFYRSLTFWNLQCQNQMKWNEAGFYANLNVHSGQQCTLCIKDTKSMRSFRKLAVDIIYVRIGIRSYNGIWY